MHAAVIPSKGIGDALLMMIASQTLQGKGYVVTTFHPKLCELKSWFNTHRIEPKFDDLSSFDLIVLQNDNSPQAKELIRQYQAGHLPNLSIFYPTHEMQKHKEPTPLDQIFDAKKSMAENIAIAASKLGQDSKPSKNNGLTPPESLILKRFPKRIIIHPSAGEEKKIWPLSSFIKVAQKLEKWGYEPVFALSPAEQARFSIPFETPYFGNLNDLASYLYESGGLIGNDSGTGHLASCFGLPTVIIANCAKRMRLWRPGWQLGEIVTPPRWFPNIKGYRLRETKWQSLTPSSRVLSRFKIIKKREAIAASQVDT